MIKFECETCFQEYKVRDERAGQILKCKSCGHKMQVPAGDDDVLDDVYDDFAAPSRPVRKKKSTGSSKGSAKKKKSSDNNTNKVISIVVGVISFGVAFYLSSTFVRGLGGKDKDKAADPPAIVQNEPVEEMDTVEPSSAVETAPSENAAATQAASAPAEKSDLPPEQELVQLSKQMGEYAKAGKEAKTDAEKKEIFDKMRATQARMKVLIDQRKAARGVAKSEKKPEPKPQKWTSMVDPPSLTFTWPESSKLKIDLKGLDDKRIVPAVNSPFVGFKHRRTRPLGIDVWNLVEAKKVGTLTIPVEQNLMQIKHDFCLTADGKYYLMPLKTRDTKTPLFSVWNVMTGEKVAEWEADKPESILTTYEIFGPTQVFAKILRKNGSKFDSILKSWDITTGNVLNEREINGSEFSGVKYRISPGGKYLFLNNYNKINIFDLSSLELIYEVDFKSLLPAGYQYASIQEIDFSPNGKELGLLTTGNDVTSVWVLDLEKGSISLGYEVPGTLSDVLNDPSYKGSELTWSPDGKSWMLYGACLVDRAGQEVLWYLKPVPNVIMRSPIVLTPNYLLVETDSALSDAQGRIRINRKPTLIPMKLPAAKIADSLAAYDSDGTSLVNSNGQQVSIEVDTGKLKFGNADEVKTVLAEVIQTRLENDGFEIEPDQPIVFKIEYKEQDGNKLQMSKRGRPTPGNPLGRTPTGETLQTTAAIFKLSWIEKATKRTLWSKEAMVNPRIMILRDATEEGAQKQMFNRLQNRLMAESIPYFIPKDKQLSTLPLELTPPD